MRTLARSPNGPQFWLVLLIAAIAVVALAISRADAQEFRFKLLDEAPAAWQDAAPESFQLLQEEAPVWKLSPAINFSISLDQKSDESPREFTDPRRTVFAYRDFSSACKYCKQIDKDREGDDERVARGEAPRLPYRIVWKQAPEWMKAYPVLKWRDLTGEERSLEGWPGAVAFHEYVQKIDAWAARQKRTSQTARR